MDCPYCGKPLKEGKVFCEACGKEIQIVPVFEPEIEAHMQSSLVGVAEVFDEQGGHRQPEQGTGSRNEKRIYIAACTVAVVLAVISLFLIVQTVLHYRSYEYQMQMADKYYLSEDYESSLKYAKRAVKIARNSSDAKMMLANCYMELGFVDTARGYLEELLENDASYMNAYQALISIYENEKNYDRINKLLLESDNTSLREQYSRYLAEPPQFGVEEGTYDEVISLKLLASGAGKVFYTLDGSTPDADSQEYMGPIQLQSGVFQVKAVFINEYGIASDVATGTYTVDLASPDEPEISVESGSYQSPQMIETFLGDDFEIYYTTDGSQPDRNSNPYLVPIPMPLGHSTFKFIMYDDEGLASLVATREYDLQIETGLSVDAAIMICKQALIQNGSILDYQGQIAGTMAHKEYELKSAFTENDQIFYLITEYIAEADQPRSKTGNQYAVNVSTSELYKASTNYAGYYVVEAFE